MWNIYYLAKLNFIKTLALERRIIKPKQPMEMSSRQSISCLKKIDPPKPPNLVLHSFPYGVDEIRDGTLTGRAAKSNFFFTEVPEPMSCRNLRSPNEITPINASPDRKKVRIIVGSPKASIARERSGRKSSLETLNRVKSIKNQIMNDFEKSLESRIKKSERMFNASATAFKQAEEQKERLRETWAKKEEKWMKTLAILAKQKQVKVIFYVDHIKTFFPY